MANHGRVIANHATNHGQDKQNVCSRCRGSTVVLTVVLVLDVAFWFISVHVCTL
jgi:hypothetical protein